MGLDGNDEYLTQRERNDGNTKERKRYQGRYQGSPPASQPRSNPPRQARRQRADQDEPDQRSDGGFEKGRKPMNCKEMVEAMEAQGLWSTPGGKTPHATLYASILRDIARGDKRGSPRSTEANSSWRKRTPTIPQRFAQEAA